MLFSAAAAFASATLIRGFLGTSPIRTYCCSNVNGNVFKNAISYGYFLSSFGCEKSSSRIDILSSLSTNRRGNLTACSFVSASITLRFTRIISESTLSGFSIVVRNSFRASVYSFVARAIACARSFSISSYSSKVGRLYFGNGIVLITVPSLFNSTRFPSSS